MSKHAKPKVPVPVELQVILRDLGVVEPDGRKLIAKVHSRAALQVKDYVQIMLSKFQVDRGGSARLRDTVAETRLVLLRARQENDCADDPAAGES
jgi:hypothetical protein